MSSKYFLHNILGAIVAPSNGVVSSSAYADAVAKVGEKTCGPIHIAHVSRVTLIVASQIPFCTLISDRLCYWPNLIVATFLTIGNAIHYICSTH